MLVATVPAPAGGLSTTRKFRATGPHGNELPVAPPFPAQLLHPGADRLTTTQAEVRDHRDRLIERAKSATRALITAARKARPLRDQGDHAVAGCVTGSRRSPVNRVAAPPARRSAERPPLLLARLGPPPARRRENVATRAPSANRSLGRCTSVGRTAGGPQVRGISLRPPHPVRRWAGGWKTAARRAPRRSAAPPARSLVVRRQRVSRRPR